MADDRPENDQKVGNTLLGVATSLAAISATMRIRGGLKISISVRGGCHASRPSRRRLPSARKSLKSNGSGSGNPMNKRPLPVVTSVAL